MAIFYLVKFNRKEIRCTLEQFGNEQGKYQYVIYSDGPIEAVEASSCKVYSEKGKFLSDGIIKQDAEFDQYCLILNKRLPNQGVIRSAGNADNENISSTPPEAATDSASPTAPKPAEEDSRPPSESSESGTYVPAEETDAGKLDTACGDPPVEVRIYLKHDFDFTWGGVYSPRFSDLDRYFSEEFRSYRPDMIADMDQIREVCVKLKHALEDKISKDRDLSDSDLRFECRIYHLINCKEDHNRREIADPENTKSILRTCGIKDEDVERIVAQLEQQFPDDSNFEQVSDSVAFVKVKAFNNAGDAYFRRISPKFRPAVGSEIVFYPKHGCTIKSVFLCSSGEEYEFECRCENEQSIRYGIASPLPLAVYQNIASGNWELKVSIIRNAKKQELSYDQNSEPMPERPDLPSEGMRGGRQHVLFMDMGSTRTKFMLVPLDGDVLNLNDLKILEVMPTYKGKRYNHKTEAFLEQMPLLQKYLRENGIAEEEIKKKITSCNQGFFEDFFVKAVEAFAKSGYAKGITLSQVWWSFPKIGGSKIDFVAASQNISKRITPWIIPARTGQCFNLVEEHIALKNIFFPFIENILNPMFREVKTFFDDKEREVDQTYNDTLKQLKAENNLLIRLFSSAYYEKEKAAKNKKDNVHNVINTGRKSDWYKALDDLFALFSAGDVKNYLFLDAGGFSTDTYCVIGSECDMVLSTSFECGGEALMNKYFELLKKSKLISENVSSAMVKAQVLVGKYTNGEKEQFIASINEVFKIVINCYAGKSDKIRLIVFSGQVTTNHLFRQVFESKNCLHVSSPILCYLLAKINSTCKFSKDTQKKYEIIKKITQGNSDRDLLLGMFNMASPIVATPTTQEETMFDTNALDALFDSNSTTVGSDSSD